VKATFSLYPDKDALADLDREIRPVYSHNPLVQINDAQMAAPSSENDSISDTASAVEETHA
jgi:hypothetical protein